MRYQSCRLLSASSAQHPTSALSTADHVASVCRSAYYHLRQIRPTLQSLSRDAAKTLVQAFISSRLDYCNSVLYGRHHRQLTSTTAVCTERSRQVNHADYFPCSAGIALAACPTPCRLQTLYGHFGPRTLRPQDTSAPIFGAEVSRTLRHWYRNVSRHFGKVRQANSRRIGLVIRRVHADPFVRDRVQLLRHITPIAQRASVDVTSGTTVAGRLAGVVALGLWQRDARRSTRQPARQTTVCDERRFTTCLLCAEVYEYITPLLRDLHWLQMPERIEFKRSVLVFRCLYGTAPPYLASELRRVADVDTRKRLRSSSTSALCHTMFVSYDDW